MTKYINEQNHLRLKPEGVGKPDPRWEFADQSTAEAQSYNEFMAAYNYLLATQPTFLKVGDGWERFKEGEEIDGGEVEVEERLSEMAHYSMYPDKYPPVMVARLKHKEAGEGSVMFYIKKIETDTVVAIHSIEPDEHRKGWMRGKVVDTGNDDKSYIGADWGISASHVFDSGLYDYSKNGFSQL